MERINSKEKVPVDRVSYEEIDENLIVVQCAFVSVVIVKGDQLAVIDSGISELMPEAIRPALQEINAKLEDVDLVINTHGHWDHVQGNPAIVEASQAKVWIPAAEMEKLTSPADRFLFDGEIIDLGNSMTFELITLPGHSAGISALFDQQKQTMIVSDAAQGYGGGIPLIFHSPRQYRASIRRLMTFDINKLVLGHPFLWSGEPAFVHRGKDVIQQFLQDCLEASQKVSQTIGKIVENNGDLTYAELEKATVEQLRSDATYGYDPAGSQWRHATILSEIRELKSVVNR